jgi:NitT/TauT family transport system substrate-binding protein
LKLVCSIEYIVGCIITVEGKLKQTARIGIATPPGMTAANGYFSAASAFGYDREEGLAFEMHYGGEPGATARALCERACDIASLNTTVGLIGREQGLPMIAVYGKARRTHRWFAVMPESSIRILPDLKGAAIACDFQHLAPLAEAALAEEGVPRGTYKWVPWRGSGMATRDMIEPLRRGDVDAVFLIDWNDGDFIAEGLRLRRLPSRALDRIKLSSCLWVSERCFKDRKDAVAGVGRALAKVTTFALENPEAAVRLMWQQEPSTRPSSGELERALRRDLEIMKAGLESFRIDPGDKDPRWGVIDGHEIVAWQEFLLASGAIRERLDPESFYSNELVERFNRFDAKRIIEAARGFGAHLGP